MYIGWTISKKNLFDAGPTVYQVILASFCICFDTRAFDLTVNVRRTHYKSTRIEMSCHAPLLILCVFSLVLSYLLLFLHCLCRDDVSKTTVGDTYATESYYDDYTPEMYGDGGDWDDYASWQSTRTPGSGYQYGPQTSPPQQQQQQQQNFDNYNNRDVSS